MDNMELKSTRLAALAVAAEAAASEYAKAIRMHSRFPEEFEVGTVLKFKHAFPPSVARVAEARYRGVEPTPIAYEYAAIRATNGFWYLTAHGSLRMVWDSLVEFIGDEECFVVKDKGWKEI